MKTRSRFRLFVFLFFLSGTLCISCIRQLNGPASNISGVSETANLKGIDNLLQEAFLSYQQGLLTEVTQKLETSVHLVQKDFPKSSVATLYTMLAFFQQKSGDSAKAATTFNAVQSLFQELHGIQAESEALAEKLRQFALHLQIADRLQFWEILRPIVRDSIGKAAEAGVASQIAEAHNVLKNFQKAYDLGIEARQLARESGQLAFEVHSSIVISMSLIGLGRFEEVEGPLQEVLPKTETNNQLKMLVLGARGMVYNARGRADLAVQDFREGISLAQSLGDLNRLAQLKSGLGNIYLSIGKPREAVQELLETLPHFESVNDELNFANTEGMIAQAYFNIESYEVANQHASRAAELFQRLGNRTEEAKNLRLVAQSLSALGKIDEALNILKKAVDIQVEERDRDEALKTFLQSNIILRREGRLDDLRRNLLAGLEANATFFGDKEGEAYIRGELGNVYRELRLFSDALDQYGKAFGLHQELSNRRAQVSSQLQIASIYGNLRNYENQLTALNLAKEIAATLNDSDVTKIILDATATAFETIGDTVEAVQNHLKALELSRKISKQDELSQLQIFGAFYYRIKENARALDCFQRALMMARDLDDRFSKAKVLTWTGLIYETTGEHGDAEKATRESLDILQAVKADKTDKYFSLAVLGTALMSQERYESAEQVFQEWVQLASGAQNPFDTQQAYECLGYVFLKGGKYVEALEVYRKAVVGFEDLWNKMGVEKIDLAKVYGEQFSAYDGIVEALFHLYSTGGAEKGKLAEEALYFTDIGKARIWRAAISEARLKFVQEIIPIEIREEEEDVNNQTFTAYKGYRSALSSYNITEDELGKRIKAWEVIVEKQRTFVEELRKQYPMYANLRYPKVFRLEELALRNDETVLVYKVGLDWTYAWVLRKMGERNEIIKFTRLPTPNNSIGKLVERFLMPFQKVKYEQFALDIAAELFQVIVQPVLEGVEPSRRLIIVPDGILTIFPFEALVTEVAVDEGHQRPHFLGDQFLISYYPTVSILTISRQAIPPSLPPEGSLLAVGDPVYGTDDERVTPSLLRALTQSAKSQGPEILTKRTGIRNLLRDQGQTFERLKHSGIEVLKISEVFGGIPGPQDVLTGFEASESRLKLKDLTRYRYLHFAVHGVLPSDIPYLKEPALVLAIEADNKEDGFLRSDEIYDLKLNADLVILSACKTVGRRVPGEGVIGLSQAFMYAGARNLIVSLWEVADDSTALLMEEFYRLLGQGVAKVEALVRAKEYLRQNGYENPYFWAPFILIGD